MRIPVASCIATCAISLAHATPHTITSIAEVRELSHEDYVKQIPFELSGQLIFQCKNLLVLRTNDECVVTYESERLKAPMREWTIGDNLVLRGETEYHENLYDWLLVDSAEVTGHAPAPHPSSVSVRDILESGTRQSLVTVTGTINAAVRDEIDKEWSYCTLSDGTNTVYVTILSSSDSSTWINKVVGATVQATGFCNTFYGLRRIMRQGVLVRSYDDIRVLSPAPDPFNVPELVYPVHTNIDNALRLGKRKVFGKVLAAWPENHVIIRLDDNRILRADLALDGKLPPCGKYVCAAGTVTTDLFRINLSDAIIREVAARETAPPANDEAIVPEGRFLTDMETLRNKVIYFGRTVRISGVLVRTKTVGAAPISLDLDTRGTRIRVNTSAVGNMFEDLAPGSVLEVTGTFVTENDNWQPNAPLPRVRDWLIVTRSPQDIRILARPPWWTSAKLACVIAVLLVALVGFILWNRWLNRLVNRRSRELLKEQVASASAELRVDERTRLAAELHDSLSQNLSGIACQLNVAKMTLEGNPETRDILQTAERMLQSCRTELTRCIWDLRGDTLEEPDFTTAIHKTLAALALPAEIQVRFNVPRSKVSDSTAHAILCIIRELVTNAIRHGRATCIKVAGGVERGNILFSVRDNGSGFDTANHPSVNEGHFGLAGIGDRISRLGGTFDLKSRPGTGASARIAIPLSHLFDSRENSSCARSRF